MKAHITNATSVGRAHKGAALALDLGLVVGLVLLGVYVYGTLHKDQLSFSSGDWKSVLRDGSQLGPSGGPKTLVEFTDYQCPYCKTANEALGGLDHSKYRVLIIHYPLRSLHAQAEAAAIAAECAKEQGHFSEFHTALFNDQEAIAREDWAQISSKVPSISLPKLRACMQSEPAKARVEKGIAIGTKVGVNGTPTFFLNRKSISMENIARLEKGTLQRLASQ
ncbi:MAG: thioredoxin domain-containing protein [Longimicrobiales bacterium]